MESTCVEPVSAQAKSGAVFSLVTLDRAGQREVHFQLEPMIVHQKKLVWQVKSPETPGEVPPPPPAHVIRTSKGIAGRQGAGAFVIHRKASGA